MTTDDGRRPPFEAGNVPVNAFSAGNVPANQQHGAYSPRVVEPVAREILAQLLEQKPAWLEATDTGALEAWAEAEARCLLVRRHVREHGLLDDKGRPTGAAELLIRLERGAADLRGRLGFDPLSRARLGKDVAAARVDLARLWADEEERS